MLIADVLAPFVDGKTYRACARDLGKERSASKQRWESGNAGVEGSCTSTMPSPQCVSTVVETTGWIHPQQGRRERDLVAGGHVFWPCLGSRRPAASANKQ